MKSSRRPCAGKLECARSTSVAVLCFAVFLAKPASSAAPAPAAKTAHGASVHALLVSDIHFEPFWDPGKVQHLAAAPVSRWKSILASPPSPNRDAQFKALQQKCSTRGEDTSYPLYTSSLRAMQKTAPDARFVTVSGDLISHAFSCKYGALLPQADPNAYRSFVAKSIQFVLEELRAALPNARIYAALGNNDSDCGDYKLDENGSFLSDISQPFAAGLPPAARVNAALTFADAGYYSASLPAPLGHTRLLVLDDTFMSRRYTACSGKADPAGADVQIAWLRAQLASARENQEHVWVMGHIPPGIDPYSTAAKLRNVCASATPEMFLSSDELPHLLAEYDDIIQLALFAYTHMDEMRLLKPDSDTGAGSGPGVPLKFVPSISPINGNSPSFVVATIDPSSAVLADYRVIAASRSDGAPSTAWLEEYDYDATYRQRAFDAPALTKLFAGFAQDPAASTEASEAYLRNYFVRDRSLELRFFWPQYVCALSAYSTEPYKTCRCATPAQ